MKQIIDGKVYNTETATEIGHDSYNGSCTDFQWWDETLYRTKKGQHFLAGKGGPRSHWSEAVGYGGYSGGSGIRLLSDEQARRWAEKHLNIEQIEAAFSVEEG